MKLLFSNLIFTNVAIDLDCKYEQPSLDENFTTSVVFAIFCFFNGAAKENGRSLNSHSPENQAGCSDCRMELKRIRSV